MNKEEYDIEKEITELKHKYKLEEIEAERKAKLEVEKMKHEDEMGAIRLKNANIRRTMEERGKF